MKSRTMPMKQMAVLLLALSAVASHSMAVEFAPAKSYAVSAVPQSVVAGDLSGDGKADLMVANPGSGKVSVLLGNGDGTFQPAVNFDAGIPTPEWIFVADFNGDGKLDVAVFQAGDTSGNAPGKISVLLGNGDGTLQAAKVTVLSVYATQIAIADFNGDQKADLAISEFSSAFSVSLMLGKGDGTFQAAMQVRNSLPCADGVALIACMVVAAADFDRDGKVDLVVAGADELQILLGQGDGTFRDGKQTQLSAGFTPGIIEIADVNGDGIIDLLVTSTQGTCGANQCQGTSHYSVLLGNGDGTFRGEQIFASGSWSRNEFGFGGFDVVGNVFAADFDGDGKVDILDRHSVKTSAFPGAASTVTMELRLGNGSGTFDPPIGFADPGNLGIAVDLNGDQLADLVVIDTTNDVDVLLAETAATGADIGLIQVGVSPEPAGVGQNLTYSVIVLNEGPESATGVTFTDNLPSAMTFASATSTAGSCGHTSLMITCNVGSLAKGQYAQITLLVTPSVAGTFTNTMTVTGNETDAIPANNTAVQTSTVKAVYTLTAVKSGTGSGTVIASHGFGSGINCGSVCNDKYFDGTFVSVTEEPDAHSIFDSWSGACTGQTCSVTMDGDKTVTASFVLGVNLIISVAGAGSGTVTSSDNALSCSNSAGTCSSLYKPGTSISLAAVPSGTSVFSGWSGACTGTDPNACALALNSNETVTATFNTAPDFALSAAAKSLTAATGSQVTDVLSISEQKGFASAIQLACSVSGPAPMPTCSLSPANIPPGTNSPTSTLTIAAPANSAYLALFREWRAPTGYRLGLALAIALVWLLTIVPSVRREMSPRWALRMAGGLACAGILISLSACGGASAPPPPQTFTITVTATSGTLQHATNVSVTVQ